MTAKSVKIEDEDTLDRHTIAAETLAAGNSQPYSFTLVNNIPSYLTL